MQMQWLLVALMFMLQPAARDKAVVFVCEHGAAKSVVATAYFNKLAAERGLPFRATFRGTAPQDNLSVRAVEGLKADGVAVPTGKADGDQRCGCCGCDAHFRHRLHASREGRSIGQVSRLVRRAGRSGIRADARRDRATREAVAG